ncbi:type II toxin-antitoxin system RelE/ParE family toxin [Polynucleobacter sp. UK-Mo-2m-Kol15]|uniref:type II toxin-antitoxin system RelE/ParE family toxin n=1 Tax=Polynucleobacter sp. UK-Mo-2m-Kol15 TaxID=2576916 RepID=UPI001C0DF968|nr:type II toxin-antitoxin system RelE/ParE family toxin [Polynucleobacter sp. UK-Mo-2m-Kol15]MBU3574812.1 type II toxin-antitoxin system RelE/ParE family toxin [Polynucleobacter sp. UK-Mo-2m-Kol15]
MRTTFKKAFVQFVKKASTPLQLAIEIRVAEVCDNPRIGQKKAGDLQGVFVYKFRFNTQEYLMAYQFDYLAGVIEITWIEFCQIGPHENFYTQLKKSIRFK